MRIGGVVKFIWGMPQTDQEIIFRNDIFILVAWRFHIPCTIEMKLLLIYFLWLLPVDT